MPKQRIKIVITLNDDDTGKAQLHTITMLGTEEQVAEVWEDLYTVEEAMYAGDNPGGSFDTYGNSDVDGFNEVIELQTSECAWADASYPVKAYEDFFVSKGLEKDGTWEITHENIEYIEVEHIPNTGRGINA